MPKAIIFESLVLFKVVPYHKIRMINKRGALIVIYDDISKYSIKYTKETYRRLKDLVIKLYEEEEEEVKSKPKPKSTKKKPAPKILKRPKPKPTKNVKLPPWG